MMQARDFWQKKKKTEDQVLRASDFSAALRKSWVGCREALQQMLHIRGILSGAEMARFWYLTVLSHWQLRDGVDSVNAARGIFKGHTYVYSSQCSFPLKIWAAYFHGCHTSVHKSEYNQRCSSMNNPKTNALNWLVQELDFCHHLLSILCLLPSTILLSSPTILTSSPVFFISCYGTLHSIIKYALFCVGWFRYLCEALVCCCKLVSWQKLLWKITSMTQCTFAHISVRVIQWNCCVRKILYLQLSR